MAKFYPDLNETLQAFIAQQHLFFTATAPHNGRVNLSPKGIDTFRCIDRHTVAYLDLTGSGNETAAHLADNGRITLMFCSFTEQPLILRLYGRGQAIPPHHAEWANRSAHFPAVPGQRQIIWVQLDTVQTSCGTGVPLYEFQQQRDAILKWAVNKGESGLHQYWQDKNQTSIDGLPTGLLEL